MQKEFGRAVHEKKVAKEERARLQAQEKKKKKGYLRGCWAVSCYAHCGPCATDCDIRSC